MQPTTKETQPHSAHAAHHDEPGFWLKYIFSTDHKVIGIQYGLTGLVFLLFGFVGGTWVLIREVLGEDKEK